MSPAAEPAPRRRLRRLLHDAGIAGAALATAIGGAAGLESVFAIAPWSSMLSCAVMAVAWSRGAVAALVTLGLAMLALDYFALPPLHSFAIAWREVPQLVVFAAAALGVTALCVSERRARAALRRLQRQSDAGGAAPLSRSPPAAPR
jgi:K+-sensing histidine kinase KdpD